MFRGEIENDRLALLSRAGFLKDERLEAELARTHLPTGVVVSSTDNPMTASLTRRKLTPALTPRRLASFWWTTTRCNIGPGGNMRGKVMSGGILRFRITLVCLLAVLLGCAGAWAQETSGSIAGTVKDPSGAVVPNATVTITDTSACAAARVRARSKPARPDSTISSLAVSEIRNQPGTSTTVPGRIRTFSSARIAP